MSDAATLRPDVVVEGLNSRAAFEKLVGSLRAAVMHTLDSRAVGESPTLGLDLTHLSGKANRVSPTWGAVLTNLLIGQYANIPLRVDLPEDFSAQAQLARSGIYFALARHHGLSAAAQWRDVLNRWADDWVPSDVQQPLFSYGQYDDGAQAPTRMQHDVVAFLNPERMPRSQADKDRRAVVLPWLAGLAATRGSSRDWSERLYDDVSQCTLELLDNVRDHSRIRHRDGFCSLTLSVTKGGGANPDRLYLSVLDNGHGIPATVRKHFDEPLAELEMVAAPFNGDLPLRQRDRGRGLHRIATLVERVGGSLFVATGPSPKGGAVLIDYKGDHGRIEPAYMPGLDVRGTVIVVMIPLQDTTAPKRT